MRFHQTDGGRQSSGFFAEKRDCTVRSLACAADIPYGDAHRILKKSGRKNGRGWWAKRGLVVAAQEGVIDFASVPLGRSVHGMRIIYPTVAQVLRRLPQGRYIFATRNHAFAVLDGVIFDTGLIGLRSRVKMVFEVKLKESPCSGSL